MFKKKSEKLEMYRWSPLKNAKMASLEKELAQSKEAERKAIDAGDHYKELLERATQEHNELVKNCDRIKDQAKMDNAYREQELEEKNEEMASMRKITRGYEEIVGKVHQQENEISDLCKQLLTSESAGKKLQSKWDKMESMFRSVESETLRSE